MVIIAFQKVNNSKIVNKNIKLVLWKMSLMFSWFFSFFTINNVQKKVQYIDIFKTFTSKIYIFLF